MKKIIYFAVAAMMFSSCNDFLDSESYTQKNTGNYPLTAEDAEQVITGIYNNPLAELNKRIFKSANRFVVNVVYILKDCKCTYFP